MSFTQMKKKASLLCNNKRVKEKKTRVTPSVFTQEMLQSTEERLSNTAEVHPPRILELLDLSTAPHHKGSFPDIDQPLFQPYPSELVFQNFTPRQTYKLPLLLLNNDKVSRQVKLEQQNSVYFSILPSSDARSNVAPGMSATFTVFFTPHENKDYHHRLVCVTEREKFEIPIRAIGPRAILDFRDKLDLPVCPVKASTEKTQLVCNAGNSKAKFRLHTERPFSVTPEFGTLDVGESMQVTVVFHPMNTGNHRQDLLLHYHTGEDVYISLHGSCEELNIHLEPDSIWMENTYVSLISTRTVSLTNHSDIPLQYCWTLWPSQQEEDLSLLRDGSVLQQKEEVELGQLLKSDPAGIHYLPLQSRAPQEHRSQDANDYLLALSHSCITAEPAEGEIWPSTTAKFTIIFKPEEARLYQQTIYCDVTGCESPLPLTVNGKGMGPQLVLNYDGMNLKDLFIGERFRQEVQLSNKGPIDAPFRWSSPDTAFGRCFSFNPEEGVVPSGACQIVEVSFRSPILGSFFEDLLLTVAGQPQPLTFTVGGSIIRPTIHFSVSELNFGDVAFGFPVTVGCTLFNPSFVPVNFILRVLGDGLGSPSVSSFKQVSDESLKDWQGHTARDLHPCPVEFTVSPAAGSVRSVSDVDIQVTLCSNTVKTYQLSLVVDIEGVGEEILTLPINARCVMPQILVDTPVLDFERCFLNQPYEQKVRLNNPSNLPACYGMLDQEYEENPSLLLGSSAPRGVIHPGTSEELPVRLLAKAVGTLHHTIRIAIFGSPQPPLVSGSEVALSCIGHGPLVHIQTTQLHFGKIPVLMDIGKTLLLSNHSPIPAHFTTPMSIRKPFWRIEPSEGEVPPGSQVELKVVVHLKDTVQFEGKLEVSIQDSQPLTVLLSATGTGTTIVSDRPFGPSLDLGTHFSHEPYQYHFKLCNHGKRVHRMYWKVDTSQPTAKLCKGGSLPNQSFLPPICTLKQRDDPRRGSSLPSSREKSMVSLRPSRLELFPGGSADMVLTVSADAPKVVRERLVCYAIVGQQGYQEKIMSVDITCRFVAPLLSISSKQLNFYIKKVKGESVRPLYEKLILKNVSSLPVSMKLSLIEPFSLCEAPGQRSTATTKSVVLGDKCEAELWVCFNPAFYKDRVSHIVDEYLEVNYLGHPQQDVVDLHAEVHYPNLDFPSTTVDFDCVLNCTETHKIMTITNCSLLPVSYYWTFLDDHINTRKTEMLKGKKKKKQKLSESQLEEWRLSSATLSPAFSAPQTPMLAADQQSSTQGPVRVEEVFDILPTHGHLQPGDQQAVTFSFYGHENISRQVVAQCHVEDGPTYEIILRGHASEISYTLDTTHLDFGQQLFHCVAEVDVTLTNTGKVGFKYSIHPHREEEEEEVGEKEVRQMKVFEHEVRPGWPAVIPAQGYLDAGMVQVLRVLYLPGIPEVFKKKLQMQVAFLPLEEITLTGVGVFPRISLNLPRNLSEECYSDVLPQARTAVEKDGVKEKLMNEITVREGAATEATRTLTYEDLLHMEIERLLVKKNALAVANSLLETEEPQESFRKWNKLIKFQLPEYILDFGFVIPGKVVSRAVKVSNNGSIPVSFHPTSKHLGDTGFTVDFEIMKNQPRDETKSFTVKFDPQGVNLNLGYTSAIFPIQVTGGPTVQVRLCAVVTMPAVTVSSDTIQFDTLQCGMCQMKTIQLLNHESVPCHWSIAEEVKPFKKIDKFLPLYKRKKALQEQRPPPVVFEMFPSSGVLSPGERVNVHIKFKPADGCPYNRRLVVRVADSTQEVFITAQGQGEDPHLEFCPSVLELGPCLPASTDVEAEVTVKNPCSFPIEFYSLEFDTQYLQEEEILRLMQDYKDNSVLLLPPRVPGEGLPSELLDYYKEYWSKMKDEELKAGMDHDDQNEDTQGGKNKPKLDEDHPEISATSVKPPEMFFSELTRLASSESLRQFEMTPVCRAVARHMGVDLSPEALVARNCRGIAIVVYGAPLTDKSSIAAALALQYGAVCLCVDDVVTDMLLNGTSPVSLTARQLFDFAATEHAQKNAKEAGLVIEETSGSGPTAASDPDSSTFMLNTANNCEDNSNENDSKAPLMTENQHIVHSLGGDVTTLRSLLPEHLLVDILAERFQLSDCYRGIVIDGLDSAYTRVPASTLQVVLKALTNRQHIYLVNLSDSYTALKARERAQREAEEALQKEKAAREEQWLQEMDEEEYNALPQEVKEHINKKHREEFRQQKFRAQMAKELEEKRQQEENQRLKEVGGKKDIKEPSRKKSLLGVKQSTGALNVLRASSVNHSKEPLGDTREQCHLSEEHHSKEADDPQKQTEGTKGTTGSPQPTDTLEKDKNTETVNVKSAGEEKELKDGKQAGERNQKDRARRQSLPAGKSRVENLQSQFCQYEESQALVEHILHHWDRRRGLLLVPLPTEDALGSAEVITEKQSSADKKSRRVCNKLISPLHSQIAGLSEAEKAEDKASPLDIPYIVLNVTEKDYMSIISSSLPPLDEVLDDLGIGPSGPPIPPPVTFSVVPFPKKREQAKLEQTCFTFLIPSRLDEKNKDKKEDELQASVVKLAEEAAGSKSHGKATIKDSAVAKDKDKTGREIHRSKKQTSAKTKAQGPDRLGSRSHASFHPEDTDQEEHQANLEQKRSHILTAFRWVVPAGGEAVLKIWFYSESPGTFKHTFNFEIVGTRRLNQLICRGVSTYPSISSDYTTVFPHSKKVTQTKELLPKTYVIKPGYFEFGPLLCGKTRDRYKENRYPENSEKLVIHNNSCLEAEVQFSFKHDMQATTYLLDPPAMTLKPNQKQELMLWSYPTKVGQMKDSLICQIKDNPELVVIELSCWGVRPELELESKHLHFDRILLHRRDSRSIMMYNKTALPVSWRLQGVEELGDEFTVPQDQGIISPNSSFPLSLRFRARRPLNIKRILRLEVSDVEKILGVVYTENIQVTAEAYDVDLEISPDGCLNFGTIRVFEEVRLSLRLKNQGKYEVSYKFNVEQTDPAQPDLNSIFKVSPQCGSLMPNKPTTVNIVFKPDVEVFIKDQPILPCQVIEPSIGTGGETVAIVAIRVSARSVFTRYKITPSSDLNFGPLIYGNKKSQSFTIENNGVFEASFTICRRITDPVRTGGPGKTISRETLSGRPNAAKIPPESFQSFLQNRLSVGMFSVSPCIGSLQPGSQQLVTVDCAAEQLGRWSQGLHIDIIGRDPSDHPDGIPYTLLAEVCKPGIVLDMASIFEEHHLCCSTSQLSSEQFCSAEGIFVLDENKFIFNKILVGQTSRARFKLTNSSKVPCMLSLAIRSAGPKSSRHIEVFDLPVTTLSIPSLSHAFPVVTFTPQAMQHYSAVFEAKVEGSGRVTPTNKTSVLEFDLLGQGTLPSVCVVRPGLRGSKGSPVLHFRQVPVGRRHIRPLVLLNNGNVPAEVQIDMLDEHGVFTLKAASDNVNTSVDSTQRASEHKSVHRVNLKLKINEPVEIEVGFCSDKPLSVKAKMSLQVKDNQQSNTTIEVTGEAYQPIISLDHISRSLQDIDHEDEEEGNYEVLNFGDCHVNVPYKESFTMTNHSSSQVLRFEWPPGGPHVSFSPQVGHLHAGCSKEVIVTFSSSEPVTLSQLQMRCKVCQVEFQQPVEEVADWDDRHKTVHWLSSSEKASDVSKQAVKDKVIRTDPEPCCSVVDGSQVELELSISAVCDYVKLSCSTDTIRFENTMLFQTRLQQLQVVNEGSMKVEFSWEVLMDPSSNIVSCDQEEGTSTSRPGSRSAGSLTEARPLANLLSLLMLNRELPPFSVEPSVGTMKPGARQNFTVRFLPLQVSTFQGKLFCSIQNLQDGEQAPCISVCGRSLLPQFHFDLEDSDYISGNRRNSEFSGPLDPNTRILEIHAIGLSVPSTRSFSVVNPTSKPYSFKWRCEDKSRSHFHCLVPSGVIPPGNKAEVCFEYVAEQLDAVESLWTFMVDTLSLSVPFLCVGTAREPITYLDRPHFDFGELLIGQKVEQAVNFVNEEDEPFHFSVVPSSLFCEDQQSRLILEPMTGTVAPKNRLPLLVSFTPSCEGYVSFKVVLRVKKKSEPLTLIIKADCFTLSTSVQVEKPEGGLKMIAPNHQETLDFGEVGISEQSTFTFLVSNLSRFILEVNFELTGPKALQHHLVTKTQNAAIGAGKQLQSSLCFFPQCICNLKDVKLNIKVKRGPIFAFDIKGKAVSPSLEFSSTKLNFGKCFLYCPGMEPAAQTLVLRNNGKRDISIQCQFKNTAFLEMDFHADILTPGGVKEIPFTFYPREPCQYHEKLTFILNSCVTKQVEILGQGIEMKLEVEHPRQKKVKLGPLKLGQKMKKQVVLVNRSSIDLSCTLMLSTDTPIDQKDLSFSPEGELKLKSSGGSCNVQIHFSPHQRIRPFTAELQAKCLGLIQPLLTIQGSCQGVEVQLDQDCLSFGAVVQHCQVKKKIVMTNTGDSSARFNWKTEDFPAELSIVPLKGFINPGMEVPFQVTFAPVELRNDTRYENLSCFVEGSSSPLTLTVTGSCIATSTSREVVNFVCPVRGSHTQTLSVLNPTNQCCSIAPVIEGEHWSAALSVNFQPHQNTAFTITYRPMTMTASGQKHQGSVFFAFPDGTGILYSLQGTADPPKAEDTIEHELPAKTSHTVLLPVHNWLSRQQRFLVQLEIVKPDKPDATVSLRGIKFIDVPAHANRDYEMSFFTYTEGQFNTKVTFRNHETSEYLFYLVTFKATSPGVLSTIELVTPVRRAASATIQVENPLTTASCLTTDCKSRDIIVPPHHTVPGQSKGVLPFEYKPLQAGESTARLTLFSSELGHFHYDLLLRALPPAPEKTVHFNALLGRSHTITVKFINYARFKTSYFCKTDYPDFIVDKSVSVTPGFHAGSQASVDVCFEPSQLGEVKGQLSLSSGVGGEYIFPLHGLCLPPQSQGPFSIKSGGNIIIPFKNVFLQTTAFSFLVDNHHFTVKGGGSIKSKEIQNIQVSFEAPPDGSPGPWFGTLTISSQSSEGHKKPYSWVYYLKGHRPELL
ncbi:hydrocephalus-inducing protein homolog isoform X1 [Oreochromis niloticus]|uniref:hydrocephalus-inducing protein homolog isoform X1 n=1 Tax=Oreochromis niloticus TaxID=8128 RepID=UPI000674DD7F|nr:hydrocephalus-inducing protein homolog isoform X1 [Oreochromis niloticus]